MTSEGAHAWSRSPLPVARVSKESGKGKGTEVSEHLQDIQQGVIARISLLALFPYTLIKRERALQLLVCEDGLSRAIESWIRRSLSCFCVLCRIFIPIPGLQMLAWPCMIFYDCRTKGEWCDQFRHGGLVGSKLCETRWHRMNCEQYCTGLLTGALERSSISWTSHRILGPVGVLRYPRMIFRYTRAIFFAGDLLRRTRLLFSISVPIFILRGHICKDFLLLRTRSRLFGRKPKGHNGQ